MALLARGDASRDLYLFDTFDWSWPDLSEWDTKYGEGTAADRNAALRERRNRPQAVLDAQGVSEARVRDFIVATGYPASGAKSDGEKPGACLFRNAAAWRQAGGWPT